MIAAVIGHRPGRLGKHNPARLTDLAVAVLRKYDPALVITGMTEGWELIVARTAADSGKPFMAAIPFLGQESGWPPETQELYQQLLGEALQPVRVLGRHTATKRALEARNRWMVNQLTPDDSIVLTLWDGKKYGPVWHCLWYASGKNIRIVNLWRAWESGRERR